MSVDVLEFIKWVLAASGPVLFVVWTWWTKRQSEIDKQRADGFSYNQAKDASMVAFGEGMRQDASSQLAEITSQALQQNYKLNDGALTRMLSIIVAGNTAQEAQLNKIVDSISQVVASMNKTIEQQALLVQLYSDLAIVTNPESDKLKLSKITSIPVQAAEDVATAATKVKKSVKK